MWVCLIYLSNLRFSPQPNVSHRNESHTQCSWYMTWAWSSKSNNWLYFMFYSQEEYTLISSWNVIFWYSGNPKCNSDKSSSRKLGKMSCVWLLGLWIWPMSCTGLVQPKVSNPPCSGKWPSGAGERSSQRLSTWEYHSLSQFTSRTFTPPHIWAKLTLRYFQELKLEAKLRRREERQKEKAYLLGKTLVIPPSVATNLATIPSLRTWKPTANQTS